MLTKSLHTVTAALNVAAYILRTEKPISVDAEVLAITAIEVLGHGGAYRYDCPTFAKIVAGCAKLLGTDTLTGYNGESLVAAAPELLAALQALVAQHDRPHGFDDSNWYSREVDSARAAIAKAVQS